MATIDEIEKIILANRASESWPALQDSLNSFANFFDSHNSIGSQELESSRSFYWVCMAVCDIEIRKDYCSAIECCCRALSCGTGSFDGHIVMAKLFLESSSEILNDCFLGNLTSRRNGRKFIYTTDVVDKAVLGAVVKIFPKRAQRFLIRSLGKFSLDSKNSLLFVLRTLQYEALETICTHLVDEVIKHDKDNDLNFIVIRWIFYTILHLLTPIKLPVCVFSSSSSSNSNSKTKNNIQNNNKWLFQEKLNHSTITPGTCWQYLDAVITRGVLYELLGDVEGAIKVYCEILSGLLEEVDLFAFDNNNSKALQEQLSLLPQDIRHGIISVVIRCGTLYGSQERWDKAICMFSLCVPYAISAQTMSSIVNRDLSSTSGLFQSFLPPRLQRMLFSDLVLFSMKLAMLKDNNVIRHLLFADIENFASSIDTLVNINLQHDDRSSLSAATGKKNKETLTMDHATCLRAKWFLLPRESLYSFLPVTVSDPILVMEGHISSGDVLGLLHAGLLNHIRKRLLGQVIKVDNTNIDTNSCIDRSNSSNKEFEQELVRVLEKNFSRDITSCRSSSLTLLGGFLMSLNRLSCSQILMAEKRILSKAESIFVQAHEMRQREQMLRKMRRADAKSRGFEVSSSETEQSQDGNEYASEEMLEIDEPFLGPSYKSCSNMLLLLSSLFHSNIEDHTKNSNNEMKENDNMVMPTELFGSIFVGSDLGTRTRRKTEKNALLLQFPLIHASNIAYYGSNWSDAVDHLIGFIKSSYPESLVTKLLDFIHFNSSSSSSNGCDSTSDTKSEIATSSLTAMLKQLMCCAESSVNNQGILRWIHSQFSCVPLTPEVIEPFLNEWLREIGVVQFHNLLLILRKLGVMLMKCSCQGMRELSSMSCWGRSSRRFCSADGENYHLKTIAMRIYIIVWCGYGVSNAIEACREKYLQSNTSANELSPSRFGGTFQFLKELTSNLTPANVYETISVAFESRNVEKQQINDGDNTSDANEITGIAFGKTLAENNRLSSPPTSKNPVRNSCFEVCANNSEPFPFLPLHDGVSEDLLVEYCVLLAELGHRHHGIELVQHYLESHDIDISAVASSTLPTGAVLCPKLFQLLGLLLVDYADCVLPWQGVDTDRIVLAKKFLLVGTSADEIVDYSSLNIAESVVVTSASLLVRTLNNNINLALLQIFSGELENSVDVLNDAMRRLSILLADDNMYICEQRIVLPKQEIVEMLMSCSQGYAQCSLFTEALNCMKLAWYEVLFRSPLPSDRSLDSKYQGGETACTHFDMKLFYSIYRLLEWNDFLHLSEDNKNHRLLFPNCMARILGEIGDILSSLADNDDTPSLSQIPLLDRDRIPSIYELALAIDPFQLESLTGYIMISCHEREKEKDEMDNNKTHQFGQMNNDDSDKHLTTTTRSKPNIYLDFITMTVPSTICEINENKVAINFAHVETVSGNEFDFWNTCEDRISLMFSYAPQLQPSFHYAMRAISKYPTSPQTWYAFHTLLGALGGYFSRCIAQGDEKKVEVPAFTGVSAGQNLANMMDHLRLLEENSFRIYQDCLHAKSLRPFVTALN